jgi:hypothetical protein
VEINKSNRLYKLYIWCLGVCAKILHNEKDVDWQYRQKIEKTNLCHFVRLIFVTTPLLLLFNFLTYILVLMVIVAPFFLLPIGSIVNMILIIFGILLTLGFAITLLFWVSNFKNYEIYETIKEYIQAKKSKICPYLYFKE